MSDVQTGVSARVLGRFGFHPGSLRMASLSGGLWTFLGYVYSYGLRLVSTLVLTRLLAPEAFGLISLASVFMMALQNFSDIGIGASVVRSAREDAAFLQTVWTMKVLRGVLLALCCAAMAWPVSRIYDEPTLFPLLLVLAITAVIDGCHSMSVLLAQRRVQVGMVTLIGMGVHTFGTAATILLAWLLGSVWALVVGGLIGAVIHLVATYVLLEPFRHGWRLERSAMMEVLRFGTWILLASLLSFVGGQGTTLVQGMLVPIEVLGLIALATTLAAAPTDLLMRMSGAVFFPAMSQIVRERPGDLKRIIWRMQALILALALPGFLLLAWASGFIIDLLYDERYGQAGEFLGILAIGAAFGILNVPYQTAVLAMGDSRSHAVVTAAIAVLRIGGLLAGFALLGVWGMLAGMGIANAFAFLVSLWIARARGFANPGLDALALGILGIAFAWVMQAHEVL